MSVLDGRLYTQYADSTHEFLVCLNTENGAEYWRVQIDSLFKNKYGSGSRSTPTIDNGVVYALSPYGKLHQMAIFMSETKKSSFASTSKTERRYQNR